MRWLYKLSLRLRSFFWKRHVEQELSDELRFHLEKQIEHYLAQGMTLEARYAALRELGGAEQIKEECRDMRRVNYLETFVQDLRYGLRMLAKSPGFTLVVVLSLALGVGANTAIFTLIDAVLLKMLPVRSPERLVHFTTIGAEDFFPYPTFKQLHDRNQVFSGVLAFRTFQSFDLEVDGQAGLANGQAVSGSYFSTLGVNAMIGRTITSEDDKAAGAAPVAVISYDYWQRRFALNPSVVGKKIILNSSPFTIIGVTPPEFFGLEPGQRVDVSIPITMLAQVKPEWAAAGTPYDVLHAPFRNWLHVMARLKPGMTEERAQASIDPIFRQAQREAAEGLAGLPFDSPQARRMMLEVRAKLEPGGRGLAALRQQFSKPLFILMVAVGLLLLIACANVATLLLGRASTRQREIGVRLALGAGRSRLMRQLMTESLLLALSGGALGLLLAFWGSSSLLTLMSHSSSPVSLRVQPDARVLAFTLLACLFTAALFGLAPAWRATGLDAGPALKESAWAMTSGSRERQRLGKGLVVSQVVLSLVLLIGAGLLVRSLEKLRSFYPGFEQDHVLLVSMNPSMVGYTNSQVAALYQSLLERIKAISGVRSASFSEFGPLGPSYSFTVPTVEGYTPRQGHEMSPVSINVVGPEYFKALETPVLLGRDFTGADGPGTPKVAIINETMARHYFGDSNPLGRRFSIPGYKADASFLQIVGVVKDAKYHDLREQTPAMAYVPFFQGTDTGAMTFEVRTAMEPNSLAEAVRREIAAQDGRLPIFGIKTLTEQVDESLVQERLVASLSSLFGLLALVLASVGLYGLMSYAVARRTSEIGLRVALGAQRGQILTMVMREILLLVTIGLAIGIPAGLAAARLISSELYGLEPGDPLTMAMATLVMMTVAAFASFLPARRASRVDPMVALRYE